MISYTLAKELKDAGFPQSDTTYTYEKGTWTHGYQHEDWTKFNRNTDRWVEFPDATTACPSLSELIEACVKLDARFDLCCTHIGFNIYIGNGLTGRKVGDVYKTPEEAVAKLWLALNNK